MLAVICQFDDLRAEFSTEAFTLRDLTAAVRSRLGQHIVIHLKDSTNDESSFASLRLRSLSNNEPIWIIAKKSTTFLQNIVPLVFLLNNEKVIVHNPDPKMTLGQYIRRHTRFTGTKLSCQQAGCGACTVMLSEIDETRSSVTHGSINSCTFPLCGVAGKSVTTTEGIGSKDKGYHPIQDAIARSWGTQCGFCTPGFVMAIYSLLGARASSSDPHLNLLPSKREMESALDGNICRCTGFRPILQAAKKFTSPSSSSCKDKKVVLDLEDLAGFAKSTTADLPCGHSSSESAANAGQICERTGETCGGNCSHEIFTKALKPAKSIAAEVDETKTHVEDAGDVLSDFVFTPPFELNKLHEVYNETMSKSENGALAFVNKDNGKTWYAPTTVEQLRQILIQHKGQKFRFVRAHTARAAFPIVGDEPLLDRDASNVVYNDQTSVEESNKKNTCCSTSSENKICCSDSTECCSTHNTNDVSSLNVEDVSHESFKYKKGVWREQPDIFVSIAFLPSLLGVSIFKKPLSKKREVICLSANGAATIAEILSTIEAHLRNIATVEPAPTERQLLAALARHLRLVATSQIRSFAGWAGNLTLCRQGGFPSDLGLLFSSLGARIAILPFEALQEQKNSDNNNNIGSNTSSAKGEAIAVRDWIAGKGPDGLITRLEIFLDKQEACIDADLASVAKYSETAIGDLLKKNTGLEAVRGLMNAILNVEDNFSSAIGYQRHHHNQPSVFVPSTVADLKSVITEESISLNEEDEDEFEDDFIVLHDSPSRHNNTNRFYLLDLASKITCEGETGDAATIQTLVKDRLASVNSLVLSKQRSDLEDSNIFMATVRCSLRRSNSHPTSNSAFVLSYNTQDVIIQHARLVLGAHRSLFNEQTNQFQFLDCVGAALRLAGPLVPFLKSSSQNRLKNFAFHLLSMVDAAVDFKPSDEYVSIYQPEGKDEYRRKLLRNSIFILICRLFAHIATQNKLHIPKSLISSLDVNTPLEASGSLRNYDDARNPNYSPVGLAIPKLTSHMQAAGEAKYVGDTQASSLGEFAYGAYAMALTNASTIVKIDISAAKTSKGVLAVLTADTLGDANNLSVYVHETVLAKDKVRYYGEPFALVIADTPENAKEAAAKAHIHTSVSEDPLILTIDDGIAHNKWVEGFESLRQRGDSKGVIGAILDGKYPDHAKFAVVKGVKVTGGIQTHGYIEKNAVVAEPLEAATRLRLMMPTQWSKLVQTNVAMSLGMPSNSIEFIHRRTGGSFGGKVSRNIMLAVSVSFAARMLNRPIKMELDAETDVAITAGRHPFKTEFDVVYNKETFEFEALRCDTVMNAGTTPESTTGVATEMNCHIESCYRFPNLYSSCKAVYSNIQSFCAVRSFGHIQAAVVSEAIIEAVAEDAHIHPDVVRLANVFRLKEQHRLVAKPLPRLHNMQLDTIVSCNRGRYNMDEAFVNIIKSHNVPQGDEFVDIARGNQDDLPIALSFHQQKKLKSSCYSEITDKFVSIAERSGQPLLNSFLTSSTNESNAIDQSKVRHECLTASVAASASKLPESGNVERHDAEVAFAAAIKMSSYSKRVREIEEFNRNHIFKKRGISLCPVRYGVSPVIGTAYVSISSFDGTVCVISGGHEMGQGLDVKVCQAVALGLGCPLESVYYHENNSLVAMSDMPSGGSVGSIASTIAAYDAALKLRKNVDKVKEVFKSENKREPQWNEIAAAMSDKQMDMQAVGLSPGASSDYNDNTEGNADLSDLAAYFNYGAAVAVVEICALTGVITPISFYMAYDCGHSLNPAVDIGQIEGGLMYGLGYLMLEEVVVCPKTGRFMNDNLWSYKLPAAVDIPRFLEVGLLPDKPNTRQKTFQSKDTGEPPMICSRAFTGAARAAVSQLNSLIKDGRLVDVMARNNDLSEFTISEYSGVKDSQLWLNGPMTVDRVLRSCAIEDEHLADAFSLFSSK